MQVLFKGGEDPLAHLNQNEKPKISTNEEDPDYVEDLYLYKVDIGFFTQRKLNLRRNRNRSSRLK